MNGYNIRANGIRHHLLHYAGTGPQLLLIPGITSPAITWGFIAERLTDRFDVHVLDVRGRGLSQAGDLDYSLDAMADDVLELIKVTGMQTPVIMGHSMGARTAIRAARKDATGMSGLILLDPPVTARAAVSIRQNGRGTKIPSSWPLRDALPKIWPPSARLGRWNSGRCALNGYTPVS
jgi:pimeloyl-ACP methyl ester carboxylesterase